MGWKGTLRSMASAAREMERAAQRHQRELQRQQREMEKMAEFERAAYEVEVYNNQLELLLSVHKQCGNPWDWQEIKKTEPPTAPQCSDECERAAKSRLEQYAPGFIDKLLKREEKVWAALAKAVEDGKTEDTKRLKLAQEKYQSDLAGYEALQKVAVGVLAGNSEAYLQAIKEVDPFSDISELGSSIEFQVERPEYVKASLYVNSDQVIPSEIKTQLKSGKLSVKPMPKGQFNELYQDYICGSALRVARELFALLPISWVFVDTIGELLNPQTGYVERQTILSVVIPRETLGKLNFDAIDCSDSMINFVHRTQFSKTKGFSKVEAVDPRDVVRSKES